MISGNFTTINPTPDYSSEESAVDDRSPAISATVPFLPKDIHNSSDNQSTADQKNILSIPVTPAPDVRPCCTAPHDQDIRIETQLSRYIQERKIPPKYLETLKHILSSENTALSQIPLVDLQNMLRSLKFSQVSTDDKHFDEYNIKLIKTGAVFFAWTALKGISIFNGTNHPSKINYVEHIIQTARKLEEEHHPVLVIYSNRGMSEKCIEEMEGYFANERNIITLCKERDLRLSFTGTEHKLHKNDHLRLEVLTSQDEVLEAATEQAKKLVKSTALTNLTTCQASSLIYTDMDNHFTEHLPAYLIAFDGAINATKLNYWLVSQFRGNPAQYPAHILLDTVTNRQFILNQKIPEEKKALSRIEGLLEYSKSNPSTDQSTKTRYIFDKELHELALTIKRNKISQIMNKLNNHRLKPVG